MRQTVKIAVTLLVVVALAMTGIALAQSSDDDTGDVAVEDTRVFAGILEQLEPLIEDGTITQSQAEAVARQLATSIQSRIDRRLDRPFDRRGPGPRALGVIAEALEFLDMTAQELRDALADGSTLADVAEEAGSSGDELVAVLLDEIEEHLDQAVENGRITEDQKDEHLAQAEEHLTALVNGEVEFPGHDRLGPGKGPRGNGPGPFGGEPPFDAEDTAA